MKDVKDEILTLLYLQNNINNRINNIITERVLRNKEVNYDEFKDSINYIMDEQIAFIERNRKQSK